MSTPRYEALLKVHGQGGVWLPMILVDLTGDHATALMLAQIIYWQPRARVQRDGCTWIVKPYEDWWKECRIKERTARRCLDRLKDLGLIETGLWKFAGTPKVHVRLAPQGIEDALESSAINSDNLSDSTRTDLPGPSGQDGRVLDPDNLTDSIYRDYSETLTEPSSSPTSLSSPSSLSGIIPPDNDNDPQEGPTDQGSGLSHPDPTMSEPVSQAIAILVGEGYEEADVRGALTGKEGDAKWATYRGVPYEADVLAESVRLAVEFADACDGAGNKRPNPFTHRECEPMRKLLVTDEKLPRHVRVLIGWTFDDDFWCSNVRCASKFREKWDQLAGGRRRDLKKIQGADASPEGEDWMARTG